MFQVTRKKVKLCDIKEGGKTNVLFLNYKYNGEKGEVQVKDYNDKFYSYILKQIKREVINNYISYKLRGKA